MENIFNTRLESYIKPKPDLRQALEELTVGNHLCLIYRKQEEQLAAAITFIEIGLRKNEKCVYIADENTYQIIKEVMELQGINVKENIEKGVLEIVDKQNTYLKGGFFDPDGMISLLKELTEKALDEGFSALRVTGEMTWALGHDTGVERLIEYEAKLNLEVFPYYKVIAICQYNANRFPANIIKGVIHTHPLIIHCNCITKNFYYIPPEEFFHRDEDKEVARLLNNIKQRAELEEKLEKSLANKQVQLANLANNLPGIVYQYLHPINNFEGRFLYISSGVSKYCGLIPKKVLNDSALFWETIYPDDLLKVKKSLLKAAINGEEWQQEWRFIVENKTIWVKCIAKISEHLDNNLIWDGLILDITKQKNIEQQLRQNKEVLHTLINSNPESIILLDIQGYILSANKSVVSRLGIKLNKIIGHHLSEILDKKLFESRWPKFNEVIKTGKPLKFEDRRGETYFDNYIHPIKDQKGNVIQLAILSIDITEYKNVTHKLEQNQLQFQTILDYAPALISIKDLDGNIILANKNFAILDLPEIDNVIGKNIFDIFPEKIAQQIWNNNLFVLKTGNSLEFEEIFTHKDGTNHIYLTINFPVFKENNLPFGVCAISTDITERKQTEQALILDQTRQELLLTLYGKQNSSEITISQFALQYVVNLTQSALGFLYFPKSDHNQQFFYYSPKNKGEIINYDHIDNLIIFHESLEKKYHFFKNKLNFLMEISENNSYLLTRYLTVPLLENEEIVAIVCVANKENDYDQGDLGQLSLFLQGMCSILQRKKAEISLKKLNLELENRVKERTKELLVTNNLLERRHQDLELLTELGDIIQMCQNVEEAYRAIAICCKKLFPELSGEISIFNPQKQLMEIVSSWGKITSNPVFKIDDCWALRGGKYHWYDVDHINLKCNHFQDQNPTACICLPMIAQGQLLGLMSLSTMNKSAEFNKSTLQIALTVIDSIKLGIANLKLRETLSKQAILDPLTKLYNRRYMDEILNRELSQLEETYKNSPDILNNLKNSMAVMMIDLDYFKKFNDTYGHDAGDFILKNIADLIKRTIRQNDTACRYGGEEFLVILPECSLEIAKQRAENIRQKIENLSLKFQDQLLEKITVSIGIAVFPEHANNRDLMIHSADLALYEAKHQGRNRVCIAQ